MKDFAAIDFETANSEPTSVCSVGVVIVRDGVVADTFYSLIKPVPEYYDFWCSQVHGLTESDTRRAPVFPEVWAEIAPRLEGLTLVAHNKAFDENCLKAVFRCYGMNYPDYPFCCTLVKSRRVWPTGRHNLDVIAERCLQPVAPSPRTGRRRSLCCHSHQTLRRRRRPLLYGSGRYSLCPYAPTGQPHQGCRPGPAHGRRAQDDRRLAATAEGRGKSGVAQAWILSG